MFYLKQLRCRKSHGLQIRDIRFLTKKNYQYFCIFVKIKQIIMAQSNFIVGDVVTLKSGGPNMTINTIISRTVSFMGENTSELEVNEIKVQWFQDNALKKGTFTEPQLKKVEEN